MTARPLALLTLALLFTTSHLIAVSLALTCLLLALLTVSFLITLLTLLRLAKNLGVDAAELVEGLTADD